MARQPDLVTFMALEVINVAMVTFYNLKETNESLMKFREPQWNLPKNLQKSFKKSLHWNLHSENETCKLTVEHSPDFEIKLNLKGEVTNYGQF